MHALKIILDKSLTRFLGLLMATMVVCITWQVVSRYLLSNPSTWTEELARFLLIWIGMYGSAYVFSIKMHLGIDLLTSKLEGNKALYVALFSMTVCGSFAFAAMVIGGANLVALTWDLNQTSPALGLKIAWIYSAIPLSGVIICFYSLYFCLHPNSNNSDSE